MNMNKILEENSSRYTFKGLRNKNVNKPNKEISSNDVDVDEYKKIQNGGFGISGAAYYEREQRFIPFYTGKIYGLRVPDSIRKYKEYVNTGGDNSGLGRYPQNYIPKVMNNLKASKKNAGEL